jgi:hypothetical protein
LIISYQDIPLIVFNKDYFSRPNCATSYISVITFMDEHC